MGNEETIIKYMILSQIPGLGPVSHRRLYQICSESGESIEYCFSLTEQELTSLDQFFLYGKSIGTSRIETFVLFRENADLCRKAGTILEECIKKNIQIITIEDPFYPDRMRTIREVPLLLYSNGTMRLNGRKHSVGIVGARRCAFEDKLQAITLTESFSESGAAIISGMAKGIDSYAHTAAIKTNGYTVAVLGSGVDICYPMEHMDLYEAIIETGCIVSEYPPGTVPMRYSFPRRNRMIAALSDEIYVIGAGRNSGTRTTIEACDRYGRPYTIRSTIRNGNCD